MCGWVGVKEFYCGSCFNAWESGQGSSFESKWLFLQESLYDVVQCMTIRILDEFYNVVKVVNFEIVIYLFNRPNRNKMTVDELTKQNIATNSRCKFS